MGSKYPLLRPRKIIAALSKKGFWHKSTKGSHAKYTDGKQTAVIPMHNLVDRWTLKDILDQANMELDEFLKLL